jgi:hypothetical protein
MSKQFEVPIDTYHQYLLEAFSALSNSLTLLDYAEKEHEDDNEKYDLTLEAGMKSRYAFLLASSGLEAAANALLLSLEISTKQYEEYEKLSTLLKFEIFCLYKGKHLARNNSLYQKIKEVVKCRNEFVHPKPRNVTTAYSNETHDVEFLIEKTKNNSYPLSFSLFEPKHTLSAIKDILTFVSWIVFDTCNYSVKDGSLLLGLNSSGNTGTLVILSKEHKIDIRSFGEF